MKCLTDPEAIQWVLAQMPELSPLAARSWPRFGYPPFPHLRQVRLTYAPEIDSRSIFAKIILRQILSAGSALVWLQEWGIFPSFTWENLLMHVRKFHSEHRSIHDAPAHVFEPSEADDAIAVAFLSYASYWDCVMIGPAAKLICHADHDEIMTIASVDSHEFQGLLSNVLKLCPNMDIVDDLPADGQVKPRNHD